MTFAQFLSVLRARKWLALLVFTLVVCTTLATSLLIPKTYTAAASVVVDFKPDPLMAGLYGTSPPLALMATQVDVINSERVALRAIRTLKLADSPQVREQWRQATDGQGNIELWMVDLFRRQMNVLPSRESSVLTVTFKSPDARFAAAMANAFVQAYLETSLELRVDPARQYSAFFDVRAKDARETLEKAQSRLSSFQKTNGIIANDERFDVENVRLNELSSQVLALQALSAESTSRQTQATSAQGDRIQEVLNNPVIVALKADVSRAEGHLQELSARLGDANPQVVQARANIDELRTRIDAETRRVTGGVSISNSINRQREGQIRAELEAQRAKVLRLKAVRDEGAVIQRDVENAQRAYDTISARLNQSSLESQTTQSNINLLTQATPPNEPSSPKILLNTVLAVLIGALLAAGVPMLLELRDRRARSANDVASFLGMPVISVLPRPMTARIAKNPSPMQQRLLAPLPGTIAAFRNSVLSATDPTSMAPTDRAASSVEDRTIGAIIAAEHKLSAEQVKRVLDYQREHQVRFGEAAVALKLLSHDDVLNALSQQFHYPYVPEGQRKLSHELVALHQPFSAQAEAFRSLRSEVMMRLWADGEPRRALAIISPDAGDGKSYVAANLALALAQLPGSRTLLVDADLRGPRQHEMFRLENRAGLSGLLSGRVDAHAIQQVDSVASLFVLPVGIAPPNPLELLECPAFGLLMRELVTKFDHVVVDTPAAVYGRDGAVIAARSGAALLVARQHKVRAAALQDLVAKLSGNHARIAGVLLNEF
jgi:chain length determinant protein tyrosine kinase EpsG